MKNTFAFIGILIAFIFSSLQAQIEPVVKALENKYSTENSYAIDFIYSFHDNSGNKISDASKGNLKLSKEKFLLKITGQELLFDGNKLYSISHEDEEVTIQNFKINTLGILTPQQILNKNEFDYTVDKSNKTVTAIPKENSSVNSIVIKYNQEMAILSFTQINQDKSKMKVKLGAQQMNIKFADNLFIFDKSKYAYYYITDLD